MIRRTFLKLAAAIPFVSLARAKPRQPQPKPRQPQLLLEKGVHSIPIDQIRWVGARPELHVVHLCELEHSMMLSGLVNPILVRQDGQLVDGRYRLEAAKMLEWDTIPAFVI